MAKRHGIALPELEVQTRFRVRPERGSVERDVAILDRLENAGREQARLTGEEGRSRRPRR